MEIEASPFIFDGPLPPTEVVGRDVELAALADRAARGRFTLLYAPRRYGKTSLIRRLQADAGDRDLVVVIVDLEGCQTVDDLGRRIADAYHATAAYGDGQAPGGGGLGAAGAAPDGTHAGGLGRPGWLGPGDDHRRTSPPPPL